ncbi:hypothetical protein OEA41_002315 [Lepraria neglecta]|uniref:Uncharacterized protein n=1 Tax=Lepraria neglecta TaxID=209136 RepID=A0AAD9ZBD4_9LECA|nr:hypothetical protein OEA41_002315 [Lepraria neglecta]
MYHSLDLFVNSKPQGQVLQHVRALSIYGPELSSIFKEPKAQPAAQAASGRQVESNENAQPDGTLNTRMGQQKALVLLWKNRGSMPTEMMKARTGDPAAMPTSHTLKAKTKHPYLSVDAVVNLEYEGGEFGRSIYETPSRNSRDEHNEYPDEESDDLGDEASEPSEDIQCKSSSGDHTASPGNNVEEENKKRQRKGKGNRDGEDAIKQASVKDSHEDLLVEYEDGSSERVNRFERY